MSFAEILAEIPHLTVEQRREVLRLLRQVETASDDSRGLEGYCSRRGQGGEVRLRAPRVIRQAEVDAVLEEFP